MLETLIVGGGIGGLAAALTIVSTGRAVHVLERAPEFGEIGAGMQLAPNASRVLDRLGVLKHLHQHAVFPSELVFCNAMTGERVSSLSLGCKFRAAFEYPYFVVHRGDVISVLADAAARQPLITWEHGKTVTALQNLDKGVRVACSDGSVYHADAVIGADGLHSVVRSQVIGDGTVQTGLVAYRGAIPFAQASGVSAPDQVVLWNGPDRHFVQYPLRSGAMYNQVAVFRPVRGDPDELDDVFAEACEQLQIAVRQVPRGQFWPLTDRDPASTWTQGRITLLGDAAHPMLQYLAQGAGQALEDAGSIARALDQAGNDVEAAFFAYENERIPRTRLVQLRAREFGDLMHLDGMSAAVRDLQLRTRDPEELDIVAWLYGEETA
jgi:salicylate hydroxylase